MYVGKVILMILFFIFNYIAFILLAWTNINLKLYIVWIISVFAITAFLYDPFLQAKLSGGSEGVDLCRHFESLDLIRLGLDEGLYIEAPMSAVYFKVIAYLFDDNSFLPLISVLLNYGLVFFTFNKFFRLLKLDTSLQRFAICMILMCEVFFGVANNIRYPLAITILFMGLYFDIVKNYMFSLFLYCLSVLMHPGVGMLLIVRCVSFIKLKYSIMCIAILTLLMSNYLETILEVLISFLSPFPDFQVLLLAISLKGVAYSSGDIYTIYFVFSLLTIYLSFFLLLCYAANRYCVQYREEFKYIYRMSVIIPLLSIIGIIANFMGAHFSERLMIISPFFIALLVVIALNDFDKTNKNYIYVKLLFFIIPIPYICAYLFGIYPSWLYLGL